MIDEAAKIAGRRYRLKSVTPADADAVVGLFTQVFGETPPAGWFDWKYGPAGLDGQALGLWDENGELVAHLGGFPRPLIWRGQLVTGLQIGDVMVAPRERGWLTRHGPFFHVCARFYRHWIGRDKAFSVSYGFPNARHMRLGVLHGLYSDLGPVGRWVWPARPGGPSPWWRIEEIAPTDADFPRRVECAWQAMQQTMTDQILGVRDAAYLHHRYGTRPGVQYRFLLVARRGLGQWGFAALAVLRVEGETLRWLDFIGPPAALTTTARAVQRMAAATNASWVEAWGKGPLAERFRAAGAKYDGETARFALAHPSSCPDEGLAEGWWMGGDTDFL